MATVKKNQATGIGCVITLFSIGVLLPTLLGLLALMGTDHQWLMFKTYILVFPIAWTSFVLSFWKPFIGGLLLILTGLSTIVGYTVIINKTPGIGQEPFLLIPLAGLIGITLILSGYSFITSRKVKQE